MNDDVLIGKIVNTHGLKGEIKIISDFELKAKVFKPNTLIYIGKEKEEVKIVSYRPHKMFDMVILENKNDIDDVLKYKGKYVYIKRKDLELKDSDYLLQEIIGFEIVEDKKTLGKIIDIVYNSKQVLLKANGEKEFYIPFLDEYIIKVDNISKKVYTKNAKDLML
jgi:16S rRNA processing protein RimM